MCLIKNEYVCSATSLCPAYCSVKQSIKHPLLSRCFRIHYASLLCARSPDRRINKSTRNLDNPCFYTVRISFDVRHIWLTHSVEISVKAVIPSKQGSILQKASLAASDLFECVTPMRQSTVRGIRQYAADSQFGKPRLRKDESYKPKKERDDMLQ